MASTSKQRKKRLKSKAYEELENYFLVVGDYGPDDMEEIDKGLSELDYHHIEDQKVLWPEGLGLTNISKKQISTAKIDILEALAKSPIKLKTVVMPSKTKLKYWLREKSVDINEIAEKARNKSKSFAYVKDRKESSPIILIRIDKENDANKTIRNRIKDEISAKEKRKEAMEKGKESILAEEDVGDLPNHLENEEMTVLLPEPEFYSPQICLAEKIVERIEVIFEKYHKKNVKSFENFYFVIYTARYNMLKDQTCARLSRIDSGCFPEEIFKYSDVEARKMSEDRVHMYQRSSLASYEALRARIEKEKETLFLIVADEAHWGTTEKGKPHDTLINTWNTEEHPNVIVLLVTATPYNLLTLSSRLPEVFYDPSTHELEHKVGQSRISKHYKHLHRVRWTDCFDDKVKKGMIVKLRIPLLHKIFQLYIDSPKPDMGLQPWKAGIPGHFVPYAEEFLLQADGNQIDESGVRITTIDQKQVFVVRDNDCGFVSCANMEGNPEGQSRFQIFHNYGEGLILLGFTGTNNRERLLYLKEDKNQISYRQARSNCGDEYVIPDLTDSFLIEQCRPRESLGPIKEYVSLNYYFNSMRNEKTVDQLIRKDTDDIRANVLKNSSENLKRDDILAAEYSYYIILINKIRKYPMNCDFIINNFEQLYQSIKDYHRQCRDCMHDFKEELQKRSTNIEPIKDLAFNEFLTALSRKVMKNFEKRVCVFQKNPEETTAAKNLFLSIISCLLHSISFDQCETERYLEEIERELKTHAVNEELSKICSTSPDDFSLEDAVEKNLLESETGCIVYHVIPKSFDKLDGCMTIFRPEDCESGNKVYKTLCIARKVSNKDNYSFEIIRDYGEFKFIHDFNGKSKTDSEIRNSRYRIRRRLQTKKCTDVDSETLESCQCSYKSGVSLKLFEPSMECKLCRHVHKTISCYQDIEKLPCILILVKKGRLGDTFPHSLKVIDSRLCHSKKTGYLSLATIVQEMGRMCRYQVKSSENCLPYALVGEHLDKTLKDSLLKGAPFHSLVKLESTQLDARTLMRLNEDDEEENGDTPEHIILASPQNSDYGNTYKHNNRILLSAEPQIGKTGVYLKVISILRRRIYPDESDEFQEEQEDEEDVTDDISDEYNQKQKDTLHAAHMSDENKLDVSYDNNDDMIYWQYPNWSHMKQSYIRKIVNENEYGKYKHGEPPPIYMPVSNKADTNLEEIQSKGVEKMKFYNFREHFCMECFPNCENQVFEFALPCNIGGSEKDVEFKISIPLVERFAALLSVVEEKQNTDSKSYSKHIQNAINRPQLNSWIFIPTYNRSGRANVNLYHTMMRNTNGEPQHSSYISVLVVRGTDLGQYYKRWQSKHAILQIPDSLPGVERDVYNGGIGFARLSIQIFAEALDLKWIFMLDDNIGYVNEVESIAIRENGMMLEKVKREKGMLVEKNVLLFDVLKHIEQQVEGSIDNTPENELPRYSDTHIKTERFEEYTGPIEKYGVIGIKQDSEYSRKVTMPFLNTHVSALVFLNIESLKKQGIQYKPWPVHDNLNLNNDCDDKGLWVCKYNRFTFGKQCTRTWLPYVYIWDEHSDLEKGFQDSSYAHNSDDILNNYLRCAFVMKYIHKLTHLNFRKSEGDFGTILRNIKEQDGTHVLIASEQISFLVSTLRQQIVTEGKGYIVLLTSSESCKEYRLTTKQLIKKWLDNIVPYEYSCEVLTSHNVNEFFIKNIVVTLKVEIPANRNGEILDSKSSASNKRPCEEEPHGGTAKMAKIGNTNDTTATMVTASAVGHTTSSIATSTTTSVVSNTAITRPTTFADTATGNQIIVTAADVENVDTTTVTSLRPSTSSKIGDVENVDTTTVTSLRPSTPFIIADVENVDTTTVTSLRPSTSSKIADVENVDTTTVTSSRPRTASIMADLEYVGTTTVTNLNPSTSSKASDVENVDTTTVTSVRPGTSSKITSHLHEENYVMLFDGCIIRRERHVTMFDYFSVHHKEHLSGLLQNLMNIALNMHKPKTFGDIRLVKRNNCWLPREVVMLPPYNSRIYDKDDITNICCQILNSICNNKINGEIQLGFLFKTEGHKGIPCKASEVTENTCVGTTFIIPDDTTQLEYSPWIDTNGINGPKVLTKGEWCESSWVRRTCDLKEEAAIVTTTAVTVKQEKYGDIGSQAVEEFGNTLSSNDDIEIKDHSVTVKEEEDDGDIGSQTVEVLGNTLSWNNDIEIKDHSVTVKEEKNGDIGSQTVEVLGNTLSMNNDIEIIDLTSDE